MPVSLDKETVSYLRIISLLLLWDHRDDLGWIRKHDLIEAIRDAIQETQLDGQLWPKVGS